MNKDKSLQDHLKLILSFSLISLLIHLCTNLFAGYGIFRDEYYYLSCASRLDIGYVDQPPFSIFILALSKALFGDSLFAIRLIPSILSAITVFLAGLIVVELNGKKLALVYSLTAIVLSPIFLAMHSFYSMNSIDSLIWTLSFYLVIRIINTKNSSLWIFLGITLGLGLLNKVGMLWLCLGLFVGLILTKERKAFRTKEPWLAASIALLIFLPFIVWNVIHDYAHLEFIRNASQYKYSGLSPIDFIIGQFMLNNPGSAIIWLAGIYYFFFNDEGKKYRIVGIIYAISFLILLINGTSKAEYLSPVYPVLFAGGGVLLESVNLKKNWKWLKYAIIAPLIISGLLLMPIVMPVLPVQTYIEYAKTLGLAPSTSEGKELGELPQFYADRFGWEELAKNVSVVYQSLPEEERGNVIAWGSNYGHAGALEYYSKKYPLPPVVSTHNNFWIWGIPQGIDIGSVIVIGGTEEAHRHYCDEVTLAKIHVTKYSMPYENNLPIFICRKINRPYDEIWNETKHFE